MTKEEAVKFLTDISYDLGTVGIEYLTVKDGKKMREAIETLSAEPQEMGYWIPVKVGKLFPSNDYKCSKCGNILDFNGVNCGRGDANFCPNCGVKMAGSEEEE